MRLTFTHTSNRMTCFIFALLGQRLYSHILLFPGYRELTTPRGGKKSNVHHSRKELHTSASVECCGVICRKRYASVLRPYTINLQRNVPRSEAPGCSAFKISMLHWICTSVRRIAFRCVLHRYGTREIHC